MLRLIFLILLTLPALADDSNEETNEEVLAKIFSNRDSFSSDNFYEETLEKAYNAFVEKDYKRSINKLDLIFSKYKERDWRYYSIRAKTHEALGQEDEAIEHYTFSVAINPAQSQVFKKLYELTFKTRKPIKSFEYIRLYLKENERDTFMRYRALILAKRLGDEKYARFALKNIQSQNSLEEDKEKILENIKNLIYKKKYKEAKEEIKKYIPHFPMNEILHNHLHIAQKNLDAKGKEMESILIDTAVLFSDNPKYSLKLAYYYKEKKMYYQALNLFRRVFYLALAKDGFALNTETVLFLKECYFQLQSTNDVRAMLSLLEIFEQKEKLELAEWNSLRINFNNNREFLIAILYFTKANNLSNDYEKFREILKERDEKKADSEFMNIYSVFVYDDFRNELP